MADDTGVEFSKAKKSGETAQWKGLQVEVPGSFFYANGSIWKGVITGVPHRKTSNAKNKIIIKFEEDEKPYTFDKETAIDWLTDKAMAEALRPTLQTTGKRRRRRSGSQSESSLNPDSSHLTPSSPPPVNGGPIFLSPLDKIPETANGTLKSSEHANDQDETSKLREEAVTEEPEALPTPSTSVVRRLRSWVSGRFQYSQPRGDNMPDGDPRPEEEDTKPLNAETDEEMLDEEDLKRLSGAKEDNHTPTPQRALSSMVWGRMKDAFYTPFSSTKMRTRQILSPEDVKEGDLGDDEADDDDFVNFRIAYEQPELRMLNDVSSDSGCVLGPSPLRKRHRFLSFFGSQSPKTSINDTFADEDGAESARNERAIQEEEFVDDEGPGSDNTMWHPVHVVLTGAVLAAWASCAYYGLWAEEAESG